MPDEIHVGDRVQVFLNSDPQGTPGWFDGVVVRIDPYTKHRSFFWVKLDGNPLKTGMISVLNPKNIRKI